MSDVASLLLEIETAHKANNTSNSSQSHSPPQSKSFLGSLFDNDDDDIDNLIKSNNNEKGIKPTPDISLCTTGKSCIIHDDPSKNHSNSNNDLFPIKSIPNQEILTDKYDIRHSFSSFDMKEIISTQQRLDTNKAIYSKQWQDDNEWHLRDEKLLLMQENAQCTIAELQHQRYVDLKNKNKTDSTVNKVTGYSIDYFVPHSLLRPRTKMEHALMEKVAMWAVEKGIQFESMIKIKQTNNPKFAFLTTAHKLHSYYTFLKQRIKTPHLFTQKSDKKVTETVKVKPMDAAKSIASHFLTYYSDDSECDNSESSSHHSHSNSNSDKCDNTMRERSYSNSRSKSRSRSRSITPILATKRSGKNSKRRKAMEMERRKTRSFSRSLSRSKSRSRSLSRRRRRRYRRSRSRSFSSMSSYSSSVDSFYRDRKRKASRKGRDKRRNYRYSRSRSRSKSRSRSRGEDRKESKRRYGRNYKNY